MGGSELRGSASRRCSEALPNPRGPGSDVAAPLGAPPGARSAGSSLGPRGARAGAGGSGPAQPLPRLWRGSGKEIIAVTAVSRGRHAVSVHKRLAKNYLEKTYARSGNQALPTLFLYPAPSFGFLIRDVGGVTLTCLLASSLPLSTAVAISFVPGKISRNAL